MVPPPTASPASAYNSFSALEVESDISTTATDVADEAPEGQTASAATQMPTSQAARQLLLARMQDGSTTLESRASDPIYVESLVQALRDRAKDLARVRQYVANLKKENDRRANALGDACYGLEPQKGPRVCADEWRQDGDSKPVESGRDTAMAARGHKGSA